MRDGSVDFWTYRQSKASDSSLASHIVLEYVPSLLLLGKGRFFQFRWSIKAQIPPTKTETGDEAHADGMRFHACWVVVACGKFE